MTDAYFVAERYRRSFCCRRSRRGKIYGANRVRPWKDLDVASLQDLDVALYTEHKIPDDMPCASNATDTCVPNYADTSASVSIGKQASKDCCGDRHRVSCQGTSGGGQGEASWAMAMMPRRCQTFSSLVRGYAHPLEQHQLHPFSVKSRR